MPDDDNGYPSGPTEPGDQDDETSSTLEEPSTSESGTSEE